MIVFLCILSFVFSSVRSEDIRTSILYVGGSGPGNYSSIQTAVATAEDGDIVFVYNGSYYENILVDKSLILSGEHKNTTIIDGGGDGFVVALLANNVTLSGFTIINSENKFPYAGIYVKSDFNVITGTILTGNYYGMHLGYLSQGNLISNNTIFQNQQCGIYFTHASNNKLFGNVVSDHDFNGFGLYEFSDNNEILNNIFALNRYTGVNIRESYQNQVTGNTFIQDNVGLHKPSPEYQTIVRDNTFIDTGLLMEEERDAIVLTVVIFDILVFFVFLVLRKIFV